MTDKTVLIEALRRDLPPIFSRRVAAEHLGGVIARGTLANLDSEGVGPGGYKGLKGVVYERESFLLWLGDWLSRREARP